MNAIFVSCPRARQGADFLNFRLLGPAFCATRLFLGWFRSNVRFPSNLMLNSFVTSSLLRSSSAKLIFNISLMEKYGFRLPSGRSDDQLFISEK